MRKNRFVRYDDIDSPSCLEIIVIASITAALIGLLGLVSIQFNFKLNSKGSAPDCSKCHYVEHHETKKMVKYLEKQKYKNPRKYIAVNLEELSR